MRQPPANCENVSRQKRVWSDRKQKHIVLSLVLDGLKPAALCPSWIRSGSEHSAARDSVRRLPQPWPARHRGSRSLPQCPLRRNAFSQECRLHRWSRASSRRRRSRPHIQTPGARTGPRSRHDRQAVYFTQPGLLAEIGQSHLYACLDLRANQLRTPAGR
jgi:hypothetical protein